MNFLITLTTLLIYANFSLQRNVNLSLYKLLPLTHLVSTRNDSGKYKVGLVTKIFFEKFWPFYGKPKNVVMSLWGCIPW